LKNTQILESMKIRSVRAALLRVETDVTKLIFDFRNFTKAPKIVFAKVAYFSKIHYHTSSEILILRI
jgi:hypothetical protein